jgi:hypothetical protein
MTMQEYKVRDQLGRTVHFTGELLAESTTQRDDAPRWTEMELYRKTDGEYLLHRLGQSVVYHELEGPCDRGTATRGPDLPADAEPCHQCDAPPMRHPRPRVHRRRQPRGDTAHADAVPDAGVAPPGTDDPRQRAAVRPST